MKNAMALEGDLESKQKVCVSTINFRRYGLYCWTRSETLLHPTRHSHLAWSINHYQLAAELEREKNAALEALDKELVREMFHGLEESAQHQAR